MIEKNTQGEVWVYAEIQDETLQDVSLELCCKARQLADQLGVGVGAVLLGCNVEKFVKPLISYGVDNIYLVEDPLLADFRTNPYAHVLVELIKKHRPQIVLYGATHQGRDLAPRVASTTRSGMTADCTDLDISDVTEKSGAVHKNLLLQIRPAFGGNIVATIVNYDQWPQMATVREGVMPMRPADPNRKGHLVRETIGLTDQTLFAVEVIKREIQKRKLNLKNARIIVAGGAGVGSKENFDLIFNLAGAFGGAVGASRAAVDSGLVSPEHQIGQTGTTVRPALYIACGISGAIQHRAGMDESAKIIAINTDREAPIFSIAHYGIVGDLKQVIPMMIKAFKERV
ncbi:MAG: electron transfer flavoprotein subunit alpha/FixB family protein [Planctomycetaceae bacterium]|jgi:electron transfer flavoprotein alpha subunit|nr:electron transfer flavoprotein subunit alpha/FixB family protein [Planctomycetaceae bacterium]